MRQDRRSIYNIMSGISAQLITLLLGLLIPRLLITGYGSEVNGLLNSVNQIFSYMALFEAGVGTATVQALYAPIARNQWELINSILTATKKYYFKTGIIYLITLLAVACVYPLFISSKLSYIFVVIVIILSGLSNVINFLIQGKFRLLLQAEGKNYILSNVNIVVSILTNLSKVILLSLGFNVITVLFISFLVSLIQAAYIVGYIQKNYKWLDLTASPNYSAISQKRAVMFHQIAYLIFHNTDVFILTFFCGLTAVSIYTVYNMINNQIMLIINQLNESIKYKLGQTYNTNPSQYMRLHNMYEIANMIIVFSAFTVFNIFALPFVRIYTRGITDANYVDGYLPILFTSIQLLSNGRLASNTLINIAGHFEQTQKRALLEAIINLSVSIVLVNRIGIYGVLIGTIAALFYRTNDIIIYCHKHILHNSSLVTYRRWGSNVLIFIALTAVCSKLSFEVDSYFEFLVYVIPAFVIVFMIYFGIQAIFEKAVYKEYWRLFKKIVKSIKKS